MSDPTAKPQVILAEDMSAREQYQMMVSLVVPRPIAWVSTRSMTGVANLAPFSYFAGLAADPMLLGISIGMRAGQPKDTLANIRATGAFCVNMVTMEHLEAMNQSAGDYTPDESEFDAAGLELAEARTVPAPYVANAPAVMECRWFREVTLGPATTTLIIGEVTAVRLRGDLQLEPGSHFVDASPLHPVGRLWGTNYAPVGEKVSLERPRVDRPRRDE